MTNIPPSAANLRGAIDLSSLVRPTTPPPSAGGAPGGQAASALVIEADDASFAQVLELSRTVPVIVEFWAAGVAPSLGAIVESYGGRLVLATIDGSANPQLAQAFQVQEVPATAAIVGGRPLQLFVGRPSDEEVRAVLDQVLQVAAQNGVTGTIDPSGEGGEAEAPEEPPLPPLHQEAYDAIAAGDLETAIARYKTAIAQDPRDTQAVAGLAQVELLQRLEGVTADAVRTAGAENPGDASAQLAVADLDLSGGHVDDAFARLLDLFPSLAPADRDAVRQRLLDYFQIVGVDDPRVVTARRRLTSLLY